MNITEVYGLNDNYREVYSTRDPLLYVIIAKGLWVLRDNEIKGERNSFAPQVLTGHILAGHLFDWVFK